MKTLISILAGLVILSMSLAGEKGSTTMEGKLVCIGCTLKNADGAKAQCKVYGHKHGFKSNTGAIYSFIENDTSKDVINDMKFHNKNAKITGIVHHAANMISLQEVEIVK